MSDNTAIEWTDATWNPVTGCSVVSPGCTNCYAMKLAGTRLKHTPSRAGLTIDTKAGPVWNGQVRLNEQWLDQPLQWKRPRRIFVCAHGDLFHESVTDEWIDRVFAVMALSPQHTFQVLTKRSARMRDYVTQPGSAYRIYELVCDLVIEDELPVVLMAPGIPDPRIMRDWPRIHLDRWPLPNVWLGVSAEDQKWADERIPDLIATPAAMRFVSAEPLLGPIDFYRTSASMPAADHPWRNGPILQGIDWVIVGGESGQGSRPMHPAWPRQIRDQCRAAGVAFFFKQWGTHLGGQGHDHGDGVWFEAAAGEGQSRWLRTDDSFDWFDPNNDGPDGPMWLRLPKKAAGRLLDGVEHNDFPEGLP